MVLLNVLRTLLYYQSICGGYHEGAPDNVYELYDLCATMFYKQDMIALLIVPLLN